MDRFLYLGYVVLTSLKHSRKLFTYARFFSKKYKRPSIYFLILAYYHYIKFSMHPLDYFYFNVYGNNNFNPNEYASTLFMYRFHKKLNDKNYTKFFKNKILFNQRFREFMAHEFISLKHIRIPELKNWIIKRNSDFLILKKNKSVGGFGVKKIRIRTDGANIYIDKFSFEKRVNYLQKFDLVEEFVQQHELINRLNPSCLNTIRVVTVLNKDNKKVDIIGAVLRLGVNNDVDNFHSGGIAVNIDIETGCLVGEGFKLAPSNPEFYSEHPVTKVKFDKYCLPQWSTVLETVKKASHIIPQVRTVGWDVAITQSGVSLIEGNHDWDKIILEKALKRGIRKDLEKYL